jgi:hypothetical protein
VLPAEKSHFSMKMGGKVFRRLGFKGAEMRTPGVCRAEVLLSLLYRWRQAGAVEKGCRGDPRATADSLGNDRKKSKDNSRFLGFASE